MKDKKKILNTYKKKVQKKYPGAFVAGIGTRYTILKEHDDLTVTDILAELFFNPAKDEFTAWELAALTVKTEQNLNRTHPLRIDGMKMEDKIARVEARKIRNETLKHSRKSDIY